MESTKQETLNLELYNAAANGFLDKVAKLLQEGADPDYHPYYGKWTALHAACANNHPTVVRALIEGKANISARDRIHYTPLHVACMYGYLNCVREFDRYGVSGIVGDSAVSPLGLALEREQFEVVKHLIITVKISPRALKDEVLELGCKKGDLDFVKLMMEKFDCDPEKQKQVILGLGCKDGDLSLVKMLINKYQCDPNDHLNIFGDTPMRFAIQSGKFPIVKYLAEECKIDPGDCLVIACKADHQGIVKYLLEKCHCDPNVKESGETPLSYARSSKVIQLLLKYGATAEDAYDLYRKSLGKVLTKDPLVNPVKMFVVGFEKEGKSTLIQSIQYEPKLFSRASVSKEVIERTPGIVPKVFKSRVFGDVQFFDFAGQEIYYNSHAAFMKSSIVNCPPVFVLVIGLHRSKKEMEKYISKWMVILKNQCSQIHGKAPLIIVGSHLDEFRGDLKEIEKFILTCLNPFKEFYESRDFLAMDCRQCNSPGIKELRELVGRRCEKIREQLSVSLNSHMFLLFLLEHYSDEVFISLNEVHDKVESDEKSKKGNQIVPFIPTSYSHLIRICTQLSDNGHILFLLNSSSPQESCIILNKATLLSEINGTIFSPEEFKQHKNIATSAGIIPKSQLANALPKYNVNMLVRFMISLELAVPIKDQMILSLVGQLLDSSEEYLLCPALISSRPPEDIWKPDDCFKYHFGWGLTCTESGQLLDNRFVEVLLLRLASFQPAKHQSCSFWKMGISWGSSVGATILVEVDSDFKAISMRMRAHSLTVECLRLRTSVMNEIRSTTKDLCNGVSTAESLFDPKDIVSYKQGSTIDISYNIGSFAESVLKAHSSVSFRYRIIDIANLVGVEVYANLGLDVLAAFFNNNLITAPISDQFLRAFSSMLLGFPHQAYIIINAITNNKRPSLPYNSSLYAALQSWSSGSTRTYKDLRDHLDQLSVFGGRNLLDLAGSESEVKPFCEDNLPDVDEHVFLETPMSPEYFTTPRGSLSAQFPAYKMYPRASLPTNSLELTSSLSSEHSHYSSFSEHSPVFSDSMDPEQSLMIRGLVTSSPQTSLNGDMKVTGAARRGSGTKGSRVVSIGELCERHGIDAAQLDCEIDLKNVQLLSECFDNVDTYLDKLGLCAGQQTDIKENLVPMRGTQIAMAKALKLWHEPHPYAATYRALLEIVLELGKGNVAVKICEFIVDKVPHLKMVSSRSVHTSELAAPEDTKDTPSDSDLKKLSNYLWELRANWYILGIQLEIVHSELEVIRKEKDSVENRFKSVISHFLSCRSSEPKQSLLKAALQSPSLGKNDLVKDLPLLKDSLKFSDQRSFPASDESRKLASRLKKVLNFLWEARAQWDQIAIELEIGADTRETIKKDYPDTSERFATLLYNYLKSCSDDLYLKELCEALRSQSVARGDIADSLEKLSEALHAN